MITKPRLICPPDLVPILGTVSDEAAARLARVSHPTIRAWRKERGIPAFAGTGRPPAVMVSGDDVRARLDALPGMCWADVGRRCGVSRQRVDQALRDGLTPKVLDRWVRRAKGEPEPTPPPTPKPTRPRKTKVLTDEATSWWLLRLRSQVGLLSWPEFAAWLGVHVSTVGNWRRKGAPIATLERAKARALERYAATDVEKV